MYLHQDLTYKTIAAAIEVHKNLGPGLLESIYRMCLEFELTNQGLNFQKELPINFLYKNKMIDQCFRLDFLIEDTLVLELKSVERILPVHEAQLLTYLRLSNKPIGLLINFNVPILKQGIHRYVLGNREIANPQNVNSKVFTTAL